MCVSSLSDVVQRSFTITISYDHVRSPSHFARMSPTPTTSRPCEVKYADDTDFISTDHEYLSKVNEIAPAALGEWFLYVNVDKTEHTNIKREIDCVAEKWRTATCRRSSANQAMLAYFEKEGLQGHRGRPRTSLPRTLDTDLQQIGMRLKSRADQHGKAAPNRIN